ncbi:MAG: chorismate synthase [Omnitrophica bacterium RBG_13_46_9]|nr:MAG: chorismate synthase [Omnitrophica bacterium RBG_13_46_9]
MNIRYLTAGESHGKALVSIIEGIPKGLKLDIGFIDEELARRMKGFGRGGRMLIEKDKVEILSGTRKGKTLGSPIALLIRNRDFKIEILPSISCPRPGHADLAGALKFGERDIRDILERASARETASRVAAGALTKTLLKEFGISFLSHVIMIGMVKSEKRLAFDKIRFFAEKSPVRCADKDISRLMCSEIKKAANSGDTLGGVFEVIINGAPPGLGSYTQWDRRLDGNLARAVMSIPGVKGFEIGSGFEAALSRGSRVHDKIFFDNKRNRFSRKSNNAGGIEGGITNGEDIIFRAAMKPIATLKKPLDSVDINTKKCKKAQVERADVCVVPSCGVIAESVCAIEIACAMVEKFGGDSISEMKRNYEGYMKQLREI